MAAFKECMNLLLILRKKSMLSFFRKNNDLICQRRGDRLILSTKLLENKHLSKRVRSIVEKQHLPDCFHWVYKDEYLYLEKELFSSFSIREETANFLSEAERILISLLEKEEKDLIRFA